MSVGLDQWMASMEELIEPYERFLPIGVALMLFQFLAVINALFFWVPTVILGVLFPILTVLGVAKETTETREAVRLSLN